MATAGPNGCIQIYQIDHQILSQKGKGVSHQKEIVIGEQSLVKISIVN